MAQLDRRDWLKKIGWGLGGMAASRRILAQPGGTNSPAVADKSIVQLSLNENPFGPAPSVVAALQQEFSRLCRYAGNDVGVLLKSIAAREGVPEDQVILGEILEPLGTYLSLQGGPGGQFIYSDPGYTALIDSAAAIGGMGVPVPLDASMRTSPATFIGSTRPGRNGRGLERCPWQGEDWRALQ